MLGFIALKVEGTEIAELKMKMRDMRNIKGENELNFLFVLDQKLRKILDDASAETQVTSILNIILESVIRFAPESQKAQQEKTDDWISKK